MRFDWIIYFGVLAVLLFVLFGLEPQGEAPSKPQERIAAHEPLAPYLPEASPLDEQVLVQVGPPQNGIGTAFAVNTRGDWLTARHVVDGCAKVSIMVAPGNFVPVARLVMDDAHDLALLSTGRSPHPVNLNLDEPLRVGDEGFLVGFPQGEPGEIATRLIARSRLVTRGRREGSSEILAWGEVSRTSGLSGALGGLSGGPVFDASGSVRGVIVAESPRRGRIYTASPEAIAAFLERTGVTPEAGPTEFFRLTAFGSPSDNARRRLQVVKVTCEVRE